MGILLNRNLPWCVFVVISDYDLCFWVCPKPIQHTVYLLCLVTSWGKMVMGGHCSTFSNSCKYRWREIAHTILIRCPGVVDRAQVQAFLLGYLSGQLGLVMVPLTLFTTWSQPAARDTKNMWRTTPNTHKQSHPLIIWATFKLQTLRIIVVFGTKSPAFPNLLKLPFSAIFFLFSQALPLSFYFCPQEEGVL